SYHDDDIDKQRDRDRRNQGIYNSFGSEALNALCIREKNRGESSVSTAIDNKIDTREIQKRPTYRLSFPRVGVLYYMKIQYKAALMRFTPAKSQLNLLLVKLSCSCRLCTYNSKMYSLNRKTVSTRETSIPYYTIVYLRKLLNILHSPRERLRFRFLIRMILQQVCDDKAGKENTKKES
ncbi:unnamed protein product, partial [Heterotrigona itama]